jgi:NAD(P)-dependent dehydrogenase (short-subunit alcohol dehydrogenase family)
MGIEKSRPVLITGCSSGIGEATAEHLADSGWNVYASARRPGAIAELERRGVKTLALDVTQESSMREAVEEVERDGPVGALINNAGYSQSGAIETVPMDSVRRQFETNVFGLMRMCQLVLPGMRRAGSGRIVNLSSMGGKLVFPGGGVYHAAKHAVEALSDALRFEVAGFGIEVVIVEPGLIATRFGEAAVGSMADTDDQGPYGEFNTAVAAITAGAYDEGAMARLAAGPEAVARRIERALTVRNPRPRYRVAASAHMLLGTRKLISDRMWDRMMRSQYPRPKADG